MSSDISYDISQIKIVQEEQTYAYLVEDIPTALAIRIALIDSAESSVDIAYYTITSGKASDIFYGALLRKANQGVKVRIIVDGSCSSSFYKPDLRLSPSSPKH